MKKFVFTTILATVLLLSCKSVHNNSLTKVDKDREAEAWKNAYKDRVFFACLKESYKANDTIFKMISKLDAFNPFDGLRVSDYHMTEKLGVKIADSISPPGLCENCKGKMNYYMATCLHYYKSKELDSIAKSAYAEHQKEEEEFYRNLKN